MSEDIGHRPRRRSRDPPQLVSRHPLLPSIDATSVPAMTLSDAVRSRDATRFLAHLDFVQMPDSRIESLFLGNNERLRKRSLDGRKLLLPPPALRRTAQQIRDFFECGVGQKREQIQHYKQHFVVTREMIQYLDSDFAPRQSDGNSVANESGRSTQSRVSFALPDGNCDEAEEEQPSMLCGGITIDYINNMRLTKSKRQSRTLGFKHTVREGWTTRSQLQHPNNNGYKWPFSLPTVSALTSGNDRDAIVWRIEELPVKSDDESAFHNFAIRHKDCTSSEVVKQDLCACCCAKKKVLMERFDSNAAKRNNPIDPKTRNDLLRTTSLQQHKTNHWMKQSRNLYAKLSYKQRALDKLLEETGVHVEVNQSTDVMR